MVEKNSEDEGSARWVLACELRRLRESSGRSLARLADEIKYDRTYLHRLETGERLSKLPVMEALDRTYGTGGLLVRLWGLARLDAFKDKYREFMQLEAKATIMHKYASGRPWPAADRGLRSGGAVVGTDAHKSATRLKRTSPLDWEAGAAAPHSSAATSGSSSMSRLCGVRRATPDLA